MTEETLRYIGCGCVVGDGNGRYLLVRETKSVARGRLALPGGGLEPDEAIVDGAVREVREETGLDVEATGLLGIFHCARTSENSYGVNFIYAATVVGGELTPSVEHPELVWLSADEIDELQAAGLIRGAHVPIAVRRREAAVDYNGEITEVSAVD